MISTQALRLLVICLPLVSACTGLQRSIVAVESRDELIEVETDEGTMLGLDVSAGSDSIVTDLLGQLWIIGGGGGSARPLTNAVADTADETDPAFSPNGRQIAFTAERRGTRGIWLLDLDSSHPTLLAGVPDRFAHIGEPAWSPDGKRIAFARAGPATAGSPRTVQIAVVDVVSGAIRQVPVENLARANLRMPAWSPDGRSIAFVEMVGSTWLTGPGGRVWKVDSNGGTATRLTPEGVRAISPALSPDGRSIAFLAPNPDGRLQVWTLDISSPVGSHQPIVLTSDADVAATRVRWASGGRSIFYSADGKIRRMSASGGTATDVPFNARLVFTRPRRTLPPARFPEPGEENPARGFAGLALSPDASQIAVLALNKLWVVAVGGAARAVATVPHTARYLTWSPDGVELAWSAGRFGQEDLFATSVSTGVTRHVTALEGGEVYPAYSPDGKWLAFTHVATSGSTGPWDSPIHLRTMSTSAPTIRDISATTDLGPTGRSWTGADEHAPQWTRGSDGMLRLSQWKIDQPAAGEITWLSGKPPTSVVLPNAVGRMVSTPNGIAWTRHDRLWSAGFDSAGVTGTPQPLGDAPAMYPSASRDGSILYVSGQGLQLRSASGAERQIGWPIRYTPLVPAPLLIRNVRIISGTGAPTTAPMDLLIVGGRIARIGTAGQLSAAGDTLDAAGRFAIPGIMDLHAHSYVPELLPSFLYFGVTLVRDQGAGAIAHLAAYADAIAANVLDGPRVSYGAFQFHTDYWGDSDADRGLEPEADPAHVTRAVALAAAFGAHHIKTRTFRRWDINARIIAEAHRLGLRVTGHCVRQMPLVAAGIDTKEHVGVCPTRGFIGSYSDMIQYGDVNKLLRAAGIGVVPTITYFGFQGDFIRDPLMLASDTALGRFMPGKTAFGAIRRLKPEEGVRHTRAAGEARQTAAKLARVGVTLGTGTDIWQMGIGVHMEMEEMVAAGLAPMAAIRAATSGSAKIAGVEQDLGTIEVGKLADLILLDRDPLVDIRNTRRIWSVIQGGRIVDRARIMEEHGWEN